MLWPFVVVLPISYSQHSLFQNAPRHPFCGDDWQAGGRESPPPSAPPPLACSGGRVWPLAGAGVNHGCDWCNNQQGIMGTGMEGLTAAAAARMTFRVAGIIKDSPPALG